MELHERIERAMTIRNDRIRRHIEPFQIVRDVRVYDYLPEKRALYPFSYQYCEIFRNLMNREGFLVQKAHHLYIQVAETEDEALSRSIAVEEWFVYGIAALDFKSYELCNQDDKSKKVLDLICTGLRDICEIDGLNREKLEKIIKIVEVNGLKSELLFKKVEGKFHDLEITYFPGPLEEGSEIYFNLIDKTTEKNYKVQKYKVDFEILREWFHTVSITRKQIIIKAGKSVRADVALKDLPREIRIDIEEYIRNFA